MEEWKDVKGYEGLYQVSNLGNVRSLNYKNTGEIKEMSQSIKDGYCVWRKIYVNDLKQEFANK